MKINEVVNKNLCFGCGLCSFLDPSIEFSQTGDFNHPEAFTSCFHCPNFIFRKNKVLQNHDNNYFGSFYKLFLLKSRNPQILSQASSGGFITDFLFFLLKAQIIDGAIVTIKAVDKPWENQIQIIKDYKFLEKNSLHSRYTQASPLIKVKELLKMKGKYVFVGKGCDIASLTKLRKVNPKINEKILFTIGIFCAHQPSRQAILDYLKDKKIKLSQIKDLNFRYGSWPGNLKIKFKNGEEFSDSYLNVWPNFLAKSKYRNFRCDLCPDGFCEQADLSIGDPWILLKKREAGSVVILRNSKFYPYLQKALKNNIFSATKIDPAFIIKSQQALVFKKKKMLPRFFLLKNLSKINFSYEGWNLPQIWQQNSLLEKIKFSLIAFLFYLKFLLNKPAKSPMK
ncbi:hypothetical protein GYA19_00885 [Candidatus Beckwithbacteria bacterium]|nr:hypothetical protein [Candidatus Beckwithbacteria bacterium]